jgi:hypothetical protein
MGSFFFCRPAAVVFVNILLVCVLLLLYCSHVVAVESEGSSASEATVTGLSFRTSRRTSIQSAADIHIVSGVHWT